MSPIKFEENIKEKLEKRSIQVSDSSWKKLEDRLKPENKKPSMNPFWRIGIAASIALVVWLTIDVLSDSKVIEPTIVTNPEKVETPTEFKVIKEDPKEIVIAVENKENTIKDKTSIIPIEKANDTNQILITDNHSEDIIEKPTTKIEKQVELSSFEDQKVVEVVAQISELKKKNKTVSVNEIETLLLQAQKEISFQKLLDKDTKTVNADVLLYQVESEINKSFRDKVFEELKIQFNSVKNVVAQRND